MMLSEMITIVNTTAQRRPNRRLTGSLLLGTAAIAVVVVAALCAGDPVVTPLEAFAALTDVSDPLHPYVADSRLPRALLGVMCGAALGLAGILMQDAMQNRIAGPELLGVSSGAAVVLTAVTVLALPVGLHQLPYVALLGAAVAGSTVLVAVGKTHDPTTMLLIGSAVTALASGLVIALVSLGTEGNLPLLFRYLLGSLSDRGWPHVAVVAPWLTVAVPAALFLRHRVAALSLGDDVAAGLGINVFRARLSALGCAGVLAAVVACVCGPVAYVALLAPHLCRWALHTTSARRVFWLTPVAGAVLLTTADLLSRIALYPIEIPVGITTTLIGVPTLLIALRRQDSAA
ncbi:iron complex transport system permease protein [Williamsia muralis]|uniref:Iron complex transport system permease protein n=2 Tax=Williamsia marianensis TaxID=85044 RepID=A0A495JXM6_WILMA|nr:iron complex transport system permease protein [Williamsia muralis]